MRGSITHPIPGTSLGRYWGVISDSVTSDERWLAAVWPFVRDSLPAPPARVIEIGCGPLGGFVPRLESAGYEVTGIDPKAPAGPKYRQVEFERYELPDDLPGGLDAVVACTSLHHVADLTEAFDRFHAVLAPGGLAVIVEWARERFDEATARWCFDRLPEPEPEGHDGWLRKRRAEWLESGQSWHAYMRSWEQAHRLHPWQDILEALERRFDSQTVGYGSYFFADLASTSHAQEQAAIDSGLIKANRVEYVGRRHQAAARSG